MQGVKLEYRSLNSQFRLNATARAWTNSKFRRNAVAQAWINSKFRRNATKESNPCQESNSKLQWRGGGTPCQESNSMPEVKLQVALTIAS